jgi:cell division protein FtsI (penicillin-binding protein 3)
MVIRKTQGVNTPGVQARLILRSHIRLLVLKFSLLLCFLAIALRLVQIQVIDASAYQEIARKQYEAKVILPATRGAISDCNGRILVSNATFVSFGVDPKIAGNDAVGIAERFSMVFGKPKNAYLAKFNCAGRRFVWLERRVRPEYSKRIQAEEFEGLIQLNEPRRIYHYEQAAGQSVGFADIDNNGLSGVELAFDQRLRGTSGYVVMQRDGLGRRRPSVDYPRVDPVNGHNVMLTIDLEYQSIAEEELRKGIERSKAESGVVVMLDPATGEVLAMANSPGINPNDIAGAEESRMRNRAITDMFEPGSVFKVVTAAAALEHHVVRPDQKIYAEHGKYVVQLSGGKTRPITDIHPFGYLTLQEGVEQSSNIVMAKVSDLVGAENFYKTARNFGFGTATGIELPGEAPGELKRPSLWSRLTLNTMAYGYEVAATPLQIAAAYAAVANGGVLMKPYIVKQIVDDHNDVVYENRPQVVRRVISKGTAQALTEFFVGAVERGTGQTAKLPGVTIAGKTGTSRKHNEGRYEIGKYTASFVGFYPANAPKVVCLVMLDNPREGGYTGGIASAPIFKGIVEKTVATSKRFVQKSAVLAGEHQLFAVPDLVSLTTETATALLSSSGLTVETIGNGRIVVRQSPNAGTKLAAGGSVKLIMDEERRSVQKGHTVVPDVRRLTIRRALNLLAINQLDAAVEGSGVVVVQSPESGENVRVGTRVTIRCEPPFRFAAASMGK